MFTVFTSLRVMTVCYHLTMSNLHRESIFLGVCLISNSGQIEFSSITTSSTHLTWPWKRQDSHGRTYYALKPPMVPQNSNFPVSIKVNVFWFPPLRNIHAYNTGYNLVPRENPGNEVAPDSFQYPDRLDDGVNCMSKSSELSSCFKTILLVLYYNYFLVTFNKYVPVKKQVIRW